MTPLLEMFVWNLVIVVPLAIAVWLVCLVPGLRRRPALCHSLWLLVLLKMVTPPLIPVPLLPMQEREQHGGISESATNLPSLGDLAASDLFLDPAMVVNARQRDNTSHNTQPSMPVLPTPTSEAASQNPWREATPYVAIAFLAFSLIVSVAIWLAGWHQFCRIRRLLGGKNVTSGHEFHLLSDVVRQFDLRRAPDLLIVDAIVTPMLWVGPKKAAIIFPRQLAETLNDDSSRNVLAHEVAHFTRCDHWSNLFSFFVTSLFWWHPVAWIARRAMSDAAEASCDALAVERTGGSRKSYAATLLAVVDFVSASKPLRPSLAVTFGQSRSITRRFEMIGKSDVKAHLPRFGWLMLTAAAATLVLIPTRAQEPETTTVPARSVDHVPTAKPLPPGVISPADAAGYYALPPQVPGGPNDPPQYADIDIFVDAAPLPPEAQLAGFWSIRVTRNDYGQTSIQKGFMAFTFERNLVASNWQAGVMTSEGDQFAQAFKIRFADRDADVWNIDIDAGGVTAPGILKFVDDGNGARIAVRFPSDGSTAPRPKSFKAKGNGFTILKLKRLGEPRQTVPISTYLQSAVGQYGAPRVPLATTLPAGVAADGSLVAIPSHPTPYPATSMPSSGDLQNQTNAKKDASAAAQNDSSELQGRWQLVSTSLPDDSQPRFDKVIEAVVVNDTWTTYEQGQPKPSRLIVVDSSADPKTISFIYKQEDSLEPTSAQALYRLKGDHLMLYYSLGDNQPHPESYQAAAVSQVWQRVAGSIDRDLMPPKASY